LRPEDTIERFGGDEFIVLLEGLTGVSDATRVAGRIAEAMQTPFVFKDREILITTSIGIVLNTSGYDHPTDLLWNADVALYRAKAKGKARYEVFDETTDPRPLKHLSSKTSLRRVI
jgi:diguanylate cyclase (GGDEF)-like protein